MSTREEKHKEDLLDILVHVARICDTGEVKGIAFALITEDGTPVYGHSISSLELLASLEMCKAGMLAKLCRLTEDATGFEDEGLDG